VLEQVAPEPAAARATSTISIKTTNNLPPEAVRTHSACSVKKRLERPPGIEAIARPPGVKSQSCTLLDVSSSNTATELLQGCCCLPSPVGRLSAEHECLPAEAGAPTPPLAWPGDGGQQHPGDGCSMTPQHALAKRDQLFGAFLQEKSWRPWKGYDRQAWTDFNANATPHLTKVYDMRAQEAEIARRGSPFGRELKRRWHEFCHRPVLPTVWCLTTWLEDLSADHSPVAVDVYITHSRGFQLVPPGVAIPRTDVPNYRPKTPVLRAQVGPELQRHRDMGFTDSYEVVHQRHPDLVPEIPHNVLPVNIQPKNELVGRVTFDPSNSGDDDTDALNDRLPTPTCCLPTYKHGAAALSRWGMSWVADDTDAFLMHPLDPVSCTNCAYRDHNGHMCCLVRMGLGFTNSPAQQQDTKIAELRAFRRRLRALGLHTAGPDPEFRKPPPVVTPGRGHELTAVLGYSDDVFGECTTTASAWFSFMHYLLLKWRWNSKLGFKERKTDAPSVISYWIGYMWLHRALQVALEEARLIKMRHTLSPFRQASLAQIMDGELQITEKEGEHTLGTLEFAANVLVLGKAFFNAMRELVKRAKARPRSQRWKPIAVPMAPAHGMMMWAALIDNTAVRSARIGVRRPVFPHEGYSDASFDLENGWCWHIMGVINYGPWPKQWAERIGHYSKYREIFITELEFIGLVFMARMIIPRARGMALCLYCDNMGVVCIVNRLSTRSKRIVPWLAELIWLAAVWDVELRLKHIATHLNCLADGGTRQESKDFAQMRRDYLRKHSKQWWDRQNRRWPPQPPARPELLPLIPVAGLDDFVESDVNEGELGRLLPEFLRFGGTPKYQEHLNNAHANADAFLQALETENS